MTTTECKASGLLGGTAGGNSQHGAPVAAPAVVRATPGPWSQSHREKPNGMWSTEVYDAAGETIAELAWYPVPQPNGWTATAREANARLIAAAPELLAALKLLAEMAPAPLFPSGEYGRALKAADALIAKAEGR